MFFSYDIAKSKDTPSIEQSPDQRRSLRIPVKYIEVQSFRYDMNILGNKVKMRVDDTRRTSVQRLQAGNSKKQKTSYVKHDYACNINK